MKTIHENIFPGGKVTGYNYTCNSNYTDFNNQQLNDKYPDMSKVDFIKIDNVNKEDLIDVRKCRQLCKDQNKDSLKCKDWSYVLDNTSVQCRIHKDNNTANSDNCHLSSTWANKDNIMSFSGRFYN